VDKAAVRGFLSGLQKVVAGTVELGHISTPLSRIELGVWVLLNSLGKAQAGAGRPMGGGAGVGGGGMDTAAETRAKAKAEKKSTAAAASTQSELGDMKKEIETERIALARVKAGAQHDDPMTQ
jgi:hypothetical protein